jgi:uncharacterized protein
MTSDEIRSRFRAFAGADRFRSLIFLTVNTLNYFAPWQYDLWNAFRAECPDAPTGINEIRKLLLWCHVHEKPLVVDQMANPIHDHRTLRLITHDRRTPEWYDAAAEAFPHGHGGLDVICPDCVAAHLEWLAEHPNWLAVYRFQMSNESIRQKFTEALDALIEQVKDDATILAAILCGSLSYDTVWARSDIDLVLVTIDDKKAPRSDLSLYADGVNVHAFLMPRAEFRKTVEGSIHNSFMHSFLAKGSLLYTHDQTIADLCDKLREIGERDLQVQLLRAATAALPAIYKAHKFFLTRSDLYYTALWILYAATPLARVEVIGARLLADREVIPQAMKLNPAFFKTVYVDLLNSKKTRKAVQTALDVIDRYVAERATTLFAPVIEHLRDVGEARSCAEIEDHFKRNFDVEGVTTACEYLADQGLIGKASTPVRLTKKSNVEVQELAFFYLEEPSDGK